VVPRLDKVVLEDLDLSPRPEPALDEWADWLGRRLFPDAEPDAGAWRNMLHQRLCMVRDEVLSFLLATALEVTPRVRLSESAKTVERGALWYEEALPAETVLAGLLAVTPIQAERRKALDSAAIFQELAGLAAKPLQLG